MYVDVKVCDLVSSSPVNLMAASAAASDDQPVIADADAWRHDWEGDFPTPYEASRQDVPHIWTRDHVNYAAIKACMRDLMDELRQAFTHESMVAVTDLRGLCSEGAVPDATTTDGDDATVESFSRQTSRMLSVEKRSQCSLCDQWSLSTFKPTGAGEESKTETDDVAPAPTEDSADEYFRLQCFKTWTRLQPLLYNGNVIGKVCVLYDIMRLLQTDKTFSVQLLVDPEIEPGSEPVLCDSRPYASRRPFIPFARPKFRITLHIPDRDYARCSTDKSMCRRLTRLKEESNCALHLITLHFLRAAMCDDVVSVDVVHNVQEQHPTCDLANATESILCDWLIYKHTARTHPTASWMDRAFLLTPPAEAMLGDGVRLFSLYQMTDTLLYRYRHYRRMESMRLQDRDERHQFQIKRLLLSPATDMGDFSRVSVL